MAKARWRSLEALLYSLMQIVDLNHVALHVSDVVASRQFYGDLLGLREKDRPEFDFEGAWYALGDVAELHLIAGRELEVHSDPRGTHFAIAVDSIASAADFLSEAGVDFDGIRHRPDGARQIFFQDPDGHWVEFVQVA